MHKYIKPELEGIATFSEPNLKYRPDIDGLRAIAILSVVLFHAFPNLLTGGFIGVDIFFVISGFLITQIFFSELKSRNVSLFGFYARRIRRIFPSLIVVLSVSLITGWYVLLPNEYIQLGKHTAGGAGFASNLVLWQEAGYFDNTSDTKPLLHLWSLAVEEQYYLAWPIFLWVIYRSFQAIISIVIIVLLMSFAANVVITGIDTAGAFYFPFYRFWELLSGSMLAIIKLDITKYDINKCTLKQLRKIIFLYQGIILNILSLVGFLAIVLGFIFISRESYFPGIVAAVPVFGATAVILSGQTPLINRIILSNPIMVGIGLISYPLYLWHWPLLTFSRIIDGGDLSNVKTVTIIAISIMLSYFTYRFVEMLIRFGGAKIIKTLFLCICLAILGGIGFNVSQRAGFPMRDHVVAMEKVWTKIGYFLYPDAMRPFDYNGRTLFRQNSERSEVTLYVGDSHMQQYYPRIKYLISKSPKAVASAVFIAEGGCLPIKGVPLTVEQQRCKGLVETAYDWAIQDKNTKTVVIGGAWTGPLNNLGSKEKYNSLLNQLSIFISLLVQGNKKVYLVLPSPTGKNIDPHFLIDRNISDFPNIFRIKQGHGLHISDLNKDLNYTQIQRDLEKTATQAGASVLNPFQYLCKNKYCPATDSYGKPIYIDGGHINPDWISKYGSFMDITLDPSS